MNKDNILVLNKTATEREAQGFDVINGSIGMMYFDDGHLPKNEIVRTTLSKHIKDDDLTYSSISGEKEYRDLLSKWFFGDTFDGKYTKTLGTQGGTGAVFTSVLEENNRYPNNILLFPELGWPNYLGIASSCNIEHIQYSLFDDDLKFNIKGILNLFDELLVKKKHISFVINDPCHNPSGYSMKQYEWDMLVNYILEKTTINDFSLIVDCAYLDFADKEIKQYAISCINKISKHVPVFLCLSCSKTFSFYGLRCGELVAICPDLSLLEDIREKTIKIARGAWSTPNHMGMNTIIEILSSEAGRKELVDEIDECKKVISKRADILLPELKQYGLRHYPYDKGFFVTLIMDNTYQISEELMKKDIYLSPLSEKHLRIELCSIPTGKISGLAKKIKLIINM